MKWRPVSGAFGHDPKDTRPELHPAKRNAKDFRAEERKPLVALATNKNLTSIGAKLAEDALKENIPAIQKLIDDFTKAVQSDQDDIVAAYALIAEEAVKPGRLAFNNVKELQADLARFKRSLELDKLWLERAKNTLEYAQKL